MDNKIVDNNTVNTIVDKLKHTRLLAGIGLAAMFLGTLLPYIKYSMFGYAIKLSLWKYWEGKIVLILLIANAIFFFKDYIEKYIPSLLNVSVWKKISELKYQYAMIPSIIAVAFILYLTIKLDINFGYYNIGFYTLWFGVICIIIYLIINKGKPVIPQKDISKQEENYNNFQNTNNETNYNINQSNQINSNMNQNYNNGMNNSNTYYGANQNNNINNSNNYAPNNVNQNNYNPTQNNFNSNNYNPAQNNFNQNNYNPAPNNFNQNPNNNVNNYNQTQNNPNINNNNNNM